MVPARVTSGENTLAGHAQRHVLERAESARGIEFHCFGYPGVSVLAEILQAQNYEQLGRQLYPAGAPDTESRYAPVPDLAAVPATDSWQRKDAAGAVHHYRAAIVCALQATDRTAHTDPRYGRHGPTLGSLPDWALANYNFTLKLFRDLAAEDRDQYAEGLVVCLDNLSGCYHRRADLPAADACFVEALETRLSLPQDREGSQSQLTLSLMNLGLVRTDLGTTTRLGRCTARAWNYAGRASAPTPRRSST